METHSLFPALSSEEPAAALEARASQKERLLLWLLMHPYQRCEDLAVAMRRHPSSTYRHLALLEARGLLEHVSISASQTKPQHVYYLTTDGIGAVARFVGADPKQMARVWEADEAHLLRLLPRLPHLLTLQTLLNTMVTAAPTIWSYGPGQPAFIRWHWLRDLRLPFHLQEKRRQCRLDAAFVWTRSSRQSRIPEGDLEYYSVLWLLDPGLVGPTDRPLMRHRLEALMQATGEHPTGVLPPTLIVTTTPRGVECWQRSATEAAAHLHRRPLHGAVVVVPPDLSTTSPWTLSWQRLSPPGPCRLRDVCVPLPRETIPAGLLAPRTLPAGFFESPRRHQKPIVIGHFAQRANAEQTKPSLPLSDEEATALLALQLTPAHREILELCYAHPLLTLEEGAALLDLQVSSFRRSVSDLTHVACLQRHATAYGTRLSLDTRGLRLLAMTLVVPFPHVYDDRHRETTTLIQRGGHEILQRLSHAVGLIRFIVALHRTSKTHGHRLLWWETGAWCAQYYTIRDTSSAFLPDAALCHQMHEHTLRLWVEWYEETVERRDLEAKLHSYARFVQTRLWATPSPILPMLLIIVATPHQERWVHQQAHQIFAKTRLVLRTTTIELLTCNGPYAPIWFPVTPEGLHRQAQEDRPDRRSWRELAARHMRSSSAE